jgi:3-isopropylmalate/(R)-2-methylmalate dehydratase large subunit
MAEPQTLAQKLIAAACGRASVAEGEIVTCAVDLAMFHDSSGPRRLQPMLQELGATLWDSSRIVLVIDHYVPESDDESRRIVRIARDWAAEQRLPNVYDSLGICHVVVPQHGHIRPGMFCVGGTEMLGVAVTGQIWVKVPQTLMMRWSGRLAPGVTAKDMMLHMIGRYGMNGGRYQAVEFCGEAVRALSMQERMTLSNMSAELGSQVGLIAPDATTVAYLREAGVTDEIDLARWRSDEGAQAEWHDFDAAALAPQVAAPHSPANARDVDQYGDVPLQVAYIGACTGAKLEDLRAAASVLRGHRLAAGMRLMVAPASRQDQRQAEAEGVMQALRDAGADVLATSCGACAGYGGSIPDGASVIATTARNFKGRMGSETAQVYLASPYTVAASAIAGRIADPREFMA